MKGWYLQPKNYIYHSKTKRYHLKQKEIVSEIKEFIAMWSSSFSMEAQILRGQPQRKWAEEVERTFFVWRRCSTSGRGLRPPLSMEPSKSKCESISCVRQGEPPTWKINTANKIYSRVRFISCLMGFQYYFKKGRTNGQLIRKGEMGWLGIKAKNVN